MVRNVKQRSLRMPEQVWEALDRLSARTGLPVSELLRQAVLAYLRDQGADLPGPDADVSKQG